VKGVILAGGTGSRLFPLTRITNKHLLPIFDRPMIEWAIEAVVASGIDEIMLVTGGTHAGEFLRLLGNGREYGIHQLSYAYQEKAGGIAEALGLAEHFAGGEPVLVMLADNVLERSIRPMVDAFRADPVGARILLSRVAEPEHLRHLGVPVFDDDGVGDGGGDSGGRRVVHIEEKPESPASEFCVTGIYCYEAGVFDIIGDLVPSGRGELEITDVNNHYVGKGQMAHDVQEGFWGDAGESIEAYYAVNDFVRQNGANRS
jgi:glucose-1-phosphate thymidylyltransferase